MDRKSFGYTKTRKDNDSVLTWSLVFIISLLALCLISVWFGFYRCIQTSSETSEQSSEQPTSSSETSEQSSEQPTSSTDPKRDARDVSPDAKDPQSIYSFLIMDHDWSNVLDDRCFIDIDGRIICRDNDTSHPSLRGSEPQVYTMDGWSETCPNYVSKDVHIVQPCDWSDYLDFRELEWATRQFGTDDDMVYNGPSKPTGYTNTMEPKNLYTQDMNGAADTDARLKYIDYVDNTYHERGDPFFEIKSISQPPLADFYDEINEQNSAPGPFLGSV